MSQSGIAAPALDHPAAPSVAGLVFALLAAVGFSFKAIFVKLSYRYGVDAETLLALRMAYSLPVFAVMGWRARATAANGKAPLSRRDYLQLAALGVFGYYLASYLDFLGLDHISAGLERVILFIYPTIVVVLSALFLGKPITRRTGVALVLCYTGVSVAVVHDFKAVSDSGAVMLGSLLVFGSAVSYALYLMGNGQVVGRLGTSRVSAGGSIVAGVLAIGQFFVLRPIGHLDQPLVVHLYALAMGILCLVLPVWCLAEAIRRIGAGPVALVGSFGPIITLAAGAVLLNEPLGLAQLAGAALVIGGVTVMARAKR
ncbi:DMT family transporter [Nitrogeniibacter mangrovi]|uniref:DMT family transporter n=1 Tax=Nitrogeniibacter mangrovi TaxID=2016596 RepID=A0A6C1B9A2_9RHOO|nr:DMT family transporter [Nitrogeniibacter mangrovi]QID19328.1 DMT family transporter [Nitrogeniibacter mangrovi]